MPNRVRILIFMVVSRVERIKKLKLSNSLKVCPPHLTGWQILIDT